MHYYYKRG
jgi:hypothetical protein